MQTGLENRANPEKVGGSIPPPSAKSFQRQMLHRASGAFSFSIKEIFSLGGLGTSEPKRL